MIEKILRLKNIARFHGEGYGDLSLGELNLIYAENGNVKPRPSAPAKWQDLQQMLKHPSLASSLCQKLPYWHLVIGIGRSLSLVPIAKGLLFT